MVLRCKGTHKTRERQGCTMEKKYQIGGVLSI